MYYWCSRQGCVQWFKDTKLKANHNSCYSSLLLSMVVSNGSKILNWKQITTVIPHSHTSSCCVQWFKDTKLKANHNYPIFLFSKYNVVSNGSKILNWKQITTSVSHGLTINSCVQWFKDTKLKANHNEVDLGMVMLLVVSNGSKILNWKQITTDYRRFSRAKELCPMVQRY